MRSWLPTVINALILIVVFVSGVMLERSWVERQKKRWDPIKYINDIPKPRPVSLKSIQGAWYDDFEIDRNEVAYLQEVPPGATLYETCGDVEPPSSSLPYMPYMCSKPASHIHSQHGPVKKHGHAGVFWD